MKYLSMFFQPKFRGISFDSPSPQRSTCNPCKCFFASNGARRIPAAAKNPEMGVSVINHMK